VGSNPTPRTTLSTGSAAALRLLAPGGYSGYLCIWSRSVSGALLVSAIYIYLLDVSFMDIVNIVSFPSIIGLAGYSCP